jgi:hypothetical protein
MSFARSNNMRDSSQRWGGNYYTNLAKTTTGVLGLGAAGYGLGYAGMKGYNALKTLSNYFNTGKDIYQGAQAGMAAKGALEGAKMLAEGSNYIPIIPGGFPVF